MFCNIINGEKVFNLHEGQKKVLKSKKRIIAAIAGTGGGKTVIGPLWLMSKIAEHREKFPNERIDILVVAPRSSLLTEVTGAELNRAFLGTDFQGQYIPSRLHYTLPHGWGDIRLASADNPTSIVGNQYHYVWIDEAGDISDQSWQEVLHRTGTRQAQILITTTPYVKNWLKHEIIDKYEKSLGVIDVITWTSVDNPAFSREEYELKEKLLPPHVFAMRYKAEWKRPEGLVYPNFEDIIVPFFEPEAGRLIGGIDFGFSDPFVCLAGVQYKDKETGKDMVYIFFEYYESKGDISEHALKIPEGVEYFCDPSRPDSIRGLILNKHEARKANNKIDLGISAVYKRIQEKTLLVSDDCKELIKESENYCYPYGEGFTNYGEQPIKKQADHCLDALRYLIISLENY